MTPFMLAFLCTIVPAVLIVVITDMAGAFKLPHPDARPLSKSQRLCRFLLLNWPWISAPFLLAFGAWRLAQADLPASSWFNIAMIVLVPVCFTLLLIQPWERKRGIQ
ncbi:hypothetical protein [Novosphingobium sp. ST904]|uniref:hypothetical protein n=1 Tax=Novosphingobium sp. ST904 TaxID=1684385 RepID=UPI000AF0BD34|nr:hypothetical protein [Novosphingobium sp. ST904]TCM32379.1 hypothetical protein EDF59_12474 [Novosphingobium sp. ST904]